MNRYKTLGIAFTALLVVGVFLRLLFIGRVPSTLFIDEINHLTNAQNWVWSANVSNVSFTGLRISLYQILSGNAFAVLFLGFDINLATRFSVLIYSILICLPLYKISNELFGNRRISYISVLIWLFSPLSFFMSLYATSLELMPLFYFLTFLFLVLKIHKNSYKLNKDWVYLAIVTFLILFIRNNLLWSFLDIVFTFLMLILYESFARNGFIKKRFSLTQEVLLLSDIFIILAIAWVLLIRRLSSYILSPSMNLALLPFNNAVILFFVRIYYFIIPQNLILLNIFPSSSLEYLPGITPMFFLSEGIVLFPAIGYSFLSLYKRKNTFQNVFLLSLMVGGYIDPIINLANSPSFAVQSEAIFAFPAFSILIAVFSNELLKNYVKAKTKSKFLSYKKAIRIFIVFLIVLTFVNIGGFLVDLSSHYNNYANNDVESPFYPYYGLKQSADYMVSHNLTSYTLFYYPNTSYNNWVNLRTDGAISYYFYTEGYPLQYLNEYSHGKIKSIKLIDPNGFPVVSLNWAIVLNQNVSYDKVLLNSGYSVKILYNVLRPDKNIAWQILKINSNFSAASKIINNSTLLNNSQNNKFKLNNSTVKILNSNFAIGINFQTSNSHLNNSKLFPLLLDSKFINIGLSNATNFPWLSPSIANGTVAYFELKSSNSSYIRYTSTTTNITANMTYFLFVTYNGSSFYFYLNNSLLCIWPSNYKYAWTAALYLTSEPNIKLTAILYPSYITPGVENSLYSLICSRNGCFT